MNNYIGADSLTHRHFSLRYLAAVADNVHEKFTQLFGYRFVRDHYGLRAVQHTHLPAHARLKHTLRVGKYEPYLDTARLRINSAIDQEYFTWIGIYIGAECQRESRI